MPQTDPLLYLKALKEDGIEYVHVQGLAPQCFLAKARAGVPVPIPINESEAAIGAVPAAINQNKIKAGTDPTSSESRLSADASVAEVPSPGIKDELQELRDKILKCKLCSELARTRNKVVFGSGNIQAKLVFVGEAPGADEDQQGLPFVGRAGQLLTKIIEAMGMTRDQAFICNVLKCRPPHNRPPAPGEVVHCRPYLKRQLEIIKPKVIVALGNHAVKALLQTEQGISQLRGSFQKYEGIPVMCTYHPAYLLRSPSEKRKVWEDMKKVMQFLKRSEE